MTGDGPPDGSAGEPGTDPGALRPARLGGRDLLREAAKSLVARPSRTVLTALGTVLGVGSLVATLAVTSSASARISSRFDALRATEVEVSDSVESATSEGLPFPPDADARLRRLAGVVAAGQLWHVADLPVTRFSGSPADAAVEVPVLAASPGALQAIHARYGAGGSFDRFHDRTGQRVVLLGRSVASRLGVTSADRQVAVFLDGVPFTVMGVVDDTDREAGLLLSVTVPVGSAEALWGRSSEPRRIIIETAPGAAELIGRQAPLALRPQEPERLAVLAPRDTRTLRGEVESDTSGLFLLLAIVSLAGGTITIANSILVSVLERVPEIGLRRALGARRRHIGGQFLAESTAIGFFGGVLGTCAGLIASVVVTASREWTTVVEPALVGVGPLLGAATGIVAGLYPAVKATRVQPVTALRR